jgi:AraC family transcriptional regulator
MTVGSLEPWTNLLRLNRSSMMANHRYADRFSVVRVMQLDDRAEPIKKSTSVPSLLVSVFVKPMSAGGYHLSFDGTNVPVGDIPAFNASIVDLEAEPTMCSTRGLDYVHFHMRRSAIDEAASELGYGRAPGFRSIVNREDIVLAQIAKSMLPVLGTERPSPLALDQLELIVGAHLVQRYGETNRTRAVTSRGLAAWQRRRVTELLRANLDGSLRLAELAQACNLSVSHFARSFKRTFGVSCHRWLIELRIERAKSLLSVADLSLTDVALKSGFNDQTAFTRTFRRIVGVPPGRWRREQ